MEISLFWQAFVVVTVVTVMDPFSVLIICKIIIKI